jgi:hypothetical protein
MNSFRILCHMQLQYKVFNYLIKTNLNVISNIEPNAK